MSIYTKTGDKGETSLFAKGVRVSKDSMRICAIGAVDELNSFVGVVRAFSDDKKLWAILRKIQSDLLTIGSILGGSELKFSSSKVKRFEKDIDKIEKNLPPLKNFIFPGGTKVGSILHFTRTLARKAEREVVALSKIEPIKPSLVIYLNRLSDYFFMLARNENFNMNTEEEMWRK